ncbi:hypothetical protein Tco_0275227 [Tanacetum coccineum]
MDYVKKSIEKRALHKMEHDNRLSLKAMGQNQKSRIQAADQGMIHMLMMQISDPSLIEEIEKKELEAHYGFMAKIQEVLPAESSSTDTPLEQVQNNDEKNVFANERQHSEKHAAECTDERAALALI